MTTPFNLAQHCLTVAGAAAEKPALILDDGAGGQEVLRYDALDLAVRRGAGALRRAGLAPRDRLVIRCGNDRDFVIGFFGAVAAGLTALPVSSQLTVAEVAAIAADSGAAAILLGRAHAGEATGYPRVSVTDAACLDEGDPVEPAATSADDPAMLIYTSGTSSRPKGVLHAQRVVLGRQPMRRDWLGLGPEDTLCHAGAVNWTYTLGVALFDVLAAGATSALLSGPRSPGIWPDMIARHRATIFAAVPGVYRQMLKEQGPLRPALATLRHGVTAGEALSPGLLSDWQAATGTHLYEALGMSEVSTYISQRPGSPPHPGSPGRPQTGRRIAILDVEGGTDPLPPGETGLLAVHRSDPGLMLGYWNRPEEDAATRRGDWFIGGDLASMDAEGFVTYQGRADEVMNPQGYRVSPLEVEAVLASHPGIAEVAVAETRSPGGAGLITAFIVPRGDPPPESALLAHCSGQLAPYKQPRVWVMVERIERNANGKVNRKALVARHHAGQGPVPKEPLTR